MGGALRRWLREERADNCRSWMGYGERWSRMDCMKNAIAWFERTLSLREPRADVHVHGRDCDYDDEGFLFRRLFVLSGMSISLVPMARPPATCGVDGVFRE